VQTVSSADCPPAAAHCCAPDISICAPAAVHRQARPAQLGPPTHLAGSSHELLARNQSPAPFSNLRPGPPSAHWLEGAPSRIDRPPSSNWADSPLSICSQRARHLAARRSPTVWRANKRPHFAAQSRLLARSLAVRAKLPSHWRAWRAAVAAAAAAASLSSCDSLWPRSSGAPMIHLGAHFSFRFVSIRFVSFRFVSFGRPKSSP